MKDHQMCELCGMVAVASVKDEHGVTHHYCEHHVPQAKPPAAACHKTGHDHHAGSPDRHAGHSVNMFRDRFWVSLLLTLPVMALAPFWQQLLGYQINFNGREWLIAALGSILFFYGGSVFFKSAWNELTARLPGMMTLISLAVISAYLYSLAITFGLLPGMDFFWEVATLITIMLLGHWIEMRAVAGAQNALQELAKLLPDTAERLTGDKTEKVAVADLKIHDRILVRPGAQLPADGQVVEGSSDVNEALLTGESRPVEKAVGATVIAGSVNGSGRLVVEITRVGADTALAGIMRLVAEAQQSKSRSQIIADRAAFWLTIIAIVVGLITLNGWLLAGAGLAFAMERLVSVLVIACPHALGLAVPLVTSISTSLAARHGLLIRDRLALESARQIDVILFDKTGTLTLGQQGVTDIVPLTGQSADEVLAIAASLEKDSEHAIGQAVMRRAGKLKLQAVSDWRSLAGQGVQGQIGRIKYAVGGPQLLRALDLTLTKEQSDQTRALTSQGKSVVYLVAGDEIVGLLAVADQIRPESAAAVASLHALGKRVAMITGDAQDVAAYVAKELKIDQVFAEVLPDHKVQQVRELQRQGLKVAMVGDGVNDAPALTQADVGIAIGAGTDVAIESAGIILVKSDPRDVANVFALSRATYRKMVQNLFWAAGYNIVAIPMAAGVLYNQGILLPPAIAAILMSFSTVIVAANAQLLRRLPLAKM